MLFNHHTVFIVHNEQSTVVWKQTSLEVNSKNDVKQHFQASENSNGDAGEKPQPKKRLKL